MPPRIASLPDYHSDQGFGRDHPVRNPRSSRRRVRRRTGHRLRPPHHRPVHRYRPPRGTGGCPAPSKPAHRPDHPGGHPGHPPDRHPTATAARNPRHHWPPGWAPGNRSPRAGWYHSIAVLCMIGDVTMITMFMVVRHADRPLGGHRHRRHRFSLGRPVWLTLAPRHPPRSDHRPTPSARVLTSLVEMTPDLLSVALPLLPLWYRAVPTSQRRTGRVPNSGAADLNGYTGPQLFQHPSQPELRLSIIL